MRTLDINGEKVFYDSEEHTLLDGFSWHIFNNDYGQTKAVVAVRGTLHLMMTRLITGAGGNERVTHQNGNSLDNRKNNLLVGGRKSHGRSNGSSQYRGVSFEGSTGKWAAAIYIAAIKKTKRVGRFATELDAALAYDEAAQAEFGEYARLNFEGGDAL